MNTAITAAVTPRILQKHRAVSYRQYLSEREQILRHKWILSEKAGSDVGFEAALVDWIAHCRETWIREHTQATMRDHQSDQQQCSDSITGIIPELVAA